MSENIVVIPVQPENEQSVMVADVPGIYEYQRVLAQTVTAKDEAEISKINAEAYKNSARVYSENAKNYAENVNVYTPAMTGTVLSWSNLMGKQNPASVDLKGPKGDAFTYADFTAEQLAGLKGPKGDDAVPAAEVQQIEANKQSIIGQSTKITELEQELQQVRKYAKGILWDNSTDDSVAHTKSMPSGAKMGSLEAIGGRSVVVNQMIDLDAAVNESGTTSSLTNDVLSINSTVNANGVLFRQRTYSSHKYYANYSVYSETSDLNIKLAFGASNITINTQANTWAKKDGIATANDRNAIYLYSAIAGTFKVKDVICIDLTQMFGSGNEPSLATCQQMFTEYIPYNTGELVSIKTTGLSVRGRNLLKTDGCVLTGWNVRNLPNLLKNNTQYIMSGTNVGVGFRPYLSTNGTSTDGAYLFGNYMPSQTTSVTFTTPANCEDYPYLVLAGLSANASDKLYECNLQIEKGTSATTYSPYTTPTTITIPSALQVEKSAGNISDTVEIYEQEGKWYAKKTQRVGSVVLTQADLTRTESYFVETTYNSKSVVYCRNLFYGSVDDCFKTLRVGGFATTSVLGEVVINNSSIASSQYRTYFMDYATKSALLSAIGEGITLYYELATPIITTTEITEPIDFECEGNGSVTFENSSNSNVGVPSTLEYIIALNEV